MSALSTFLVGLTVGTLATYAAFAGRVASIETTIAVHSAALAEQESSIKAELAILSDMRTQLASLSAQLPPKGR